MEWWFYIPAVVWCLFVLVFGLMVGSFLNVLIARLPYEKSIIWPGSRCFSCYGKLRTLDNLPIVGYIRLKGKCRFCGAPFSSRYLWVELGTGLAFLGLFLFEVMVNPARLPGVRFTADGLTPYPNNPAIALFFYHAVLLSLLIAAAVIDAEHRIIPPLIPYTGAIIGIIGGALMPWPWTQDSSLATLPPGTTWILEDQIGKVPVGVQPWPYWLPLHSFAPAGSWKLGLMNAVVGALLGSLVIRWIKWLFELGFGREALGMGDADLLMMAGAFLGWQIAVFSMFAGAIAALLVFKIPSMILAARQKAAVDRELSFGPGLAVGVVATWLTWPWLGPRMQFPMFDLEGMGLIVGVISVGVLAAGLLLRRSRGAEPVAQS